MRKVRISLLILLAFAILLPSSVLAQAYSFQLPRLTVDVYWNSDGSQSLDYNFSFTNNNGGHTIEYVDLGLPNSSYDINSIQAWVNGNQVYDISTDFQGEGSDGVAIGLGAYSIAPGDSGVVRIFVGVINGVLYNDSQDSNYASAVFSPAYFTSDVVNGITDLTVTYHFPPEVKPEEPRWHAAPDGFPSEPQTGIDQDGRIIYSWNNPNANGYTVYTFGASFPNSYVPDTTIMRNNPFAWLGRISLDALVPLICVVSVIAMVVSGAQADKRRKMQYLPPKISIEGHGIKRGLTAVEAAVLLEEPLDKVFTMILFSVVKKNAASVVTRDPLELTLTDPAPEDLQPYEKDFLAAFKESGAGRRKAMRDMTVALVKMVSEKMRGFSRGETLVYYRDITKRAWAQVEAADTPEVKSQKYEEAMEWTMLDRDYEGRTREVFRNYPVFIPSWWGRYDPSLGHAPSPKPMGTAVPSTPSTGKLPSVPGADFAASVVGGVEGFATKVVGNITDFTSSVTSATNPPPKATSASKGGWSGGSRSGGSGCACACACACAGCACACAGGGR